MEKYHRAPEITELRLRSQKKLATVFQRGCGQMRRKPPVTKLLVATAKIYLRFYDRQQYMVCLLPVSAETQSVKVALSLGFARHFVSASYITRRANVMQFYVTGARNLHSIGTFPPQPSVQTPLFLLLGSRLPRLIQVDNGTQLETVGPTYIFDIMYNTTLSVNTSAHNCAGYSDPFPLEIEYGQG